MDCARWSNARNFGETESIDRFIYDRSGDAVDRGEPNDTFLNKNPPDSTGGSVRVAIISTRVSLQAGPRAN